MSRRVAMVALCAMLISPVSATTYFVTPDGSGDYSTIQAAIEAVVDGDIIELTDGTFTGEGNRNVDYLGKAVTVQSQNGAEACIIDCQGSEADQHRGFHFHTAEPSEAELIGVTVIGGWAAMDPGGGAVLIEAASSPSIRQCIFTGNRDAAITCWGGWSQPTFTHCVFQQNENAGTGGAIHSEAAVLTFSHCDFIENHSVNGGAMRGYAGAADISNCTFRQNTSHCGGALNFIFACTATVRDCLFADNSATRAGAVSIMMCNAVFERCTFAGNSSMQNTLRSVKMASVQIRGCTFWGNSSLYHPVVYCGEMNASLENTVVAFSQDGSAVGGGVESNITLTCCDLYGNPGGDWVGSIADQYGINGNISEDPLFCDPENGDFTLQESSPCAPFSPPNPECDLIGAWTVGCGGTPVTENTWGGIKAMFRR